jgi:hypothetical protein
MLGKPARSSSQRWRRPTGSEDPLRPLALAVARRDVSRTAHQLTCIFMRRIKAGSSGRTATASEPTAAHIGDDLASGMHYDDRRIGACVNTRELIVLEYPTRLAQKTRSTDFLCGVFSEVGLPLYGVLIRSPVGPSGKFAARNSHMADDPPLASAHTCPSWLAGGPETRPSLLRMKG